jgi:biofilm protein TabA
MIASSLEHIERQLSLTDRLKKALDFLRGPGIPDLPDGRVEIDGDNVYAVVQRYETTRKNNPKFEYHRKYIDVQFIASGVEVIGWTPAETITVTESYDREKDIAFGDVGEKQWTPLLLHAGRAAVFYPEDGHAPKLAADMSMPVMKIVVKVLL